MTRTFDKLPSGFRGRTLKTVKLLTRAGLSVARRNLTGPSKSTPGDGDDSRAVAAAEKLLVELDGMKGLAMKLGQMASYLDHSLPPRAQRVLARLQSESKPMDVDVVRRAVQVELGAAPEDLFDAFDDTPFAAASIGQVHRAELGGRALAVKVQYPGVIDALESDLSTVGRLARFGFMLSAVDGKAMAAELRARILEECDYEREARSQLMFHQLLSVDADRDVPEVIWSRSGKTVLTSVMSDRQRFQDFCDTASQEARDRAGQLIFDTCFGTIFHHGVFNCDPHPGNYLFSSTGEVTFLDFGCLKWFSPEFIDTWKQLARTLIDDDRSGFPDAFRATGMVARERRFDWDYHWNAMRQLYAPLRSDEPTVYTAEFLERINAALVFDNPNKFRLTVPRDWLFCNRLQFGLLSVLSQLRSRVSCARSFREAVESTTVPLTLPEAPAI